MEAIEYDLTKLVVDLPLKTKNYRKVINNDKVYELLKSKNNNI